eukprot:TRINITY_DN5892_c0_g1_i1.p1 TRINITY_DN5892_c0_g1~~TRINITY_DN5892_c0_g1_i1.p1  ORF type:complete len:362 (+),score=-12.68 TRINITY_DN5892_c0_g1_i1:35-1120(+)
MNMNKKEISEYLDRSFYSPGLGRVVRRTNRSFLSIERSLMSLKGLHSVQTITRHLRGKKGLTSTIKIPSPCDQSHMHALSKQVHRFPRLKELELNLTNHVNLENVTFEHLRTIFNYSADLQALSLCLSECGNLNESNAKLITNCISKMANLTSLRLELCKGHNVSDEFIHGICIILTTCRRIKSLYLNLAWNSFRNENYKGELTQAILTHPSLQYLECYLSGWRYTAPRSCENLWHVFKRIQTLKRVHFSLKNCQIAQNSVIKPCSRNRFYSAAKIDLNFSESDTVNDQTCLFIARELFFNKFLMFLRLDLRKCSKISDRGVLMISTCFKEFRCLQGIELDFTGCGNITETSCQHLSLIHI